MKEDQEHIKVVTVIKREFNVRERSWNSRKKERKYCKQIKHEKECESSSISPSRSRRNISDIG